MTNFLTNIYYLSTCIFLYEEILWIMQPTVESKKSMDFFMLEKQNKGKKYEEYSEDFKSAIRGRYTGMYSILWAFIGLFTFQFDFFTLFLMLQIIIVGSISKLTRKYFVPYTILHWLNSIIGFAFGIFIILNHYHFHINIYNLK